MGNWCQHLYLRGRDKCTEGPGEDSDWGRSFVMLASSFTTHLAGTFDAMNDALLDALRAHHKYRLFDCGGDDSTLVTVEPGDAQTSVLRHVDVMLLPQVSDLRTAEPSDGEHTLLLNQMLPSLLP